MIITRYDHENTTCIYCFVNKTNGKRYIGLTKKLYQRYNQHKNGHSCAPKFLNALIKYGWDGFDFEILEECSIELLEEKETYWIKLYKTTDDKYGYNILEQQGHTRPKYSEISKQRMKLAQQKLFPNGRSGSNNLFYGRKHTNEAKRKMSVKAMGHSRRSKPMIAYNDKEIVEFKDTKYAAKILNGHRNLIWEAVKQNKMYKGYYWKYKDKE